MSQRDPNEKLAILDKFDLESPDERRIALFTLNDYFGAVFADVGELLDFRTSDYQMSIGHQWNKASSRLEKVDSVDIPEEYGEALHTIDTLRGNYAHDFRDYPPKDPIESASDTAPNWADWIRDAAVNYEEYQESLTATEALVQVGERALDHNLDDWRGYPPHFSDQVRELQEQEADLAEELQSFSNDREVSKELVEAISGVLEWERDLNEFEEQFEYWEQQEAKRLEMEDKAENTHNFIVVERQEEYDSISVVKHEVGQPDDMYTFTISNCPITESEMDTLRELETNDEIRLWVGSKMYRDSNGYIDYDYIIKGVV